MKNLLLGLVLAGCGAEPEGPDGPTTPPGPEAPPSGAAGGPPPGQAGPPGGPPPGPAEGAEGDCPHDPVATFTNVAQGIASSCDLAAYEGFLASRHEVPGPWAQALHQARSTDGSTFREHPEATLPSSHAFGEVVQLEDGQIVLFAVDGDVERARQKARAGSDWFATHGITGQGAIRAYRSADGQTFTEDEAFELTGLPVGRVTEPDVVRLPDGRWRMYLAVQSVTDLVVETGRSEPTLPAVHTAHSTDLSAWTLDALPLLEEVEGGAAGWCQGPRCGIALSGLRVALSEDGGLRFSEPFPLTHKGFAPDVVVTGDSQLRLYYNDPDQARIQTLVSSDGGRTWVAEPGVRLEEVFGEAPSVIALPGGGWHMVYHRFKRGEETRFRSKAPKGGPDH